MDPKAMMDITKNVTQKVVTPGFLNGAAWFLFPSMMGKALTNQKKGEMNAEIAAQGILEEAILNGRINVPPNSTPEQVISGMQNMIYMNTLGQQIRESIENKFWCILSDEEKDSKLWVREDFANRVYRLAESCITEEAQERWARLIAGECREPGSISLRTIDVLHNLSSEEAILFDSYAGLVFDGLLFATPSPSLYADISRLHDIGILQETLSIAEIEIKKSQQCILVSGTSKFYIENCDDTVLKLRGRILTGVGRELAKLSLNKPNFDLLIASIDGTNRNFNYGIAERDAEETCTRTKSSLISTGLTIGHKQ